MCRLSVEGSVVCREILLIEDERDARETLQLLLELEGYRVASAPNGREGLNALARSAQAPCLIVLDLMMPVMNGWEFLEALERDHRQVLNDTAVVVVSAAAEIGQLPDELGCRVMKKPFELAALLKLAQQHCTCESTVPS